MRVGVVRPEGGVVSGYLGASALLAGIDPVPWARAQMAFTLGFHIILVPLGVSWALMTLIANYRGLRRRDDDAPLDMDKLYASITAPLAQDNDSVEMSSMGPESPVRADFPVSGAYLICDKEALAFYYSFTDPDEGDGESS